MTKEDLNFIKDAFSQIIDDIAGNPDWGDAARAVASDLGTLERKLEKRVTELPSNLDEAAEEYYDEMWDELGGKAMVVNYEHDIWYPSSVIETVFKAGAEWMAGQGVSMQVTDDTEWSEVDLVVHKNVCEGSIIQIRKK